VWDAAVVLYYYYPRRRPVSAQAWKECWTGYAGVLEEMIAEVPARGTNRLQRKLSLDINSFIPEFVGNWGRRARMTSTARVGFGKPVRPISANVPRPTAARDPEVGWREWFDSSPHNPPGFRKENI
jgi:hypothetical protein